jgi:hypothetical protein
MAISHAQSFIGSTHWIVNNERSAWRGESCKSDPMSVPGHFPDLAVSTSLENAIAFLWHRQKPSENLDG